MSILIGVVQGFRIWLCPTTIEMSHFARSGCTHRYALRGAFCSRQKASTVHVATVVGLFTRDGAEGVSDKNQIQPRSHGVLPRVAILFTVYTLVNKKKYVFYEAASKYQVYISQGTKFCFENFSKKIRESSKTM